MRLICPNCDAQYEVADTAIPDEGRDVQCSNCGHGWFQLSPHAIAAAEAEAELFEAPEPVAVTDEEAPAEADALIAGDVPQTDVPPAPEVPVAEEPAAVPPPVAATPRRSMDENLMAVLREEAEREAQARAKEEPRPLETQGELGLEAATAAAAISPSARRIAQLKGIDPDAMPEPEVITRAPKGRELLPDIEEINSTLRPSVDRGEDAQALADVGPSLRQDASFRSGFALMLLLAAGLALAYVMAPRIAQQIPGTADAMTAYVAAVDAARLWLDAWMQRAIMALQG